MVKKIFIGALCLVVTFSALGCSSTNLKTNMTGEYNLIPKIAGKDFEVLGLVSVKTTEVKTKSPLYLSINHEGERVTFDSLIQEARARYPNVSDIINVRIDKTYKGKRTLIDWLTGSETTIEYAGTALAIRYTTALQEQRDPLEGRSGTLPGGFSGSSDSSSFIDTIRGLFGP